MKNIKKFLSGILMALFIGGLLCPYFISKFLLPSEIKFISGEEHLLKFRVPLQAHIAKSQGLIIKNSNQQKVQSKQIDLNKPIYVEMTDEGVASVKLSFMGIIPLKTVSVQAFPKEELIPCGKVVGIKVDMKGPLVLGVGEFETEEGMVSPCKGKIEVGDVILSCNGKSVRSKEDLRDCILEGIDKKVTLRVQHRGKERNIDITPCLSSSEQEYKIGLWIKDSTQGIGTITYINPKTQEFGALGHGITDVQTHLLSPVSTGEIMRVFITNIIKGQKGDPGELSGVIDYNERSELGCIMCNDSLGIYGKVYPEFIKDQEYSPCPVAFQDEVYPGKAEIRVNLIGDKVQSYEIEIQKVSRYVSEPSKGMIIKITDKRLLNMTNGIIQGMSGSPILQDGKLIGAVTHVFVNEPNKGYGIFIENMLQSGSTAIQ